MATGALPRAKTAGNLDADFHHAEGALGFVVGKGQFPRPQEGQNVALIALQPVPEVLFLGLLEAFGRELLRGPRVGLAAGASELPIALLPPRVVRFI